MAKLTRDTRLRTRLRVGLLRGDEAAETRQQAVELERLIAMPDSPRARRMLIKFATDVLVQKAGLVRRVTQLELDERDRLAAGQKQSDVAREKAQKRGADPEYVDEMLDEIEQLQAGGVTQDEAAKTVAEDYGTHEPATLIKYLQRRRRNSVN